MAYGTPEEEEMSSSPWESLKRTRTPREPRRRFVVEAFVGTGSYPPSVVDLSCRNAEARASCCVANEALKQYIYILRDVNTWTGGTAKRRYRLHKSLLAHRGIRQREAGGPGEHVALLGLGGIEQPLLHRAAAVAHRLSRNGLAD